MWPVVLIRSKASWVYCVANDDVSTAFRMNVSGVHMSSTWYPVNETVVTLVDSPSNGLTKRLSCHAWRRYSFEENNCKGNNHIFTGHNQLVTTWRECPPYGAQSAPLSLKNMEKAFICTEQFFLYASFQEKTL